MRITKIELCDFRGFPGPATYTFDLGAEGKNLLLYGENGSGKSSLFRALVEFFNLSSTAKPFAAHKNIFSDPNATNGKIAVTFQNQSTPLTWPCNGNRATADLLVAQTALRKGCLDYRDLLKVNFVHTTGPVNLFDLLVGALLTEHTVVATGGRQVKLGTLWQQVLDAIPEHHRGRHGLERIRSACDDFNTATAPVWTALQQQAEELLQAFPGCDVALALEFPGIFYDVKQRALIRKELYLHVDLHGQSIQEHQHFLNEARLSAIAFTLYLAGLLISIPPSPTAPSLLVLDDVLIGLDLANRLPVLEILGQRFRDWQIILMTYDRSWYEIAKQRLSNWKVYELFINRIGSHEQAHPLEEKDLLWQATEFLEQGHVKAAAVYVRSKFELVLKRACIQLRLPVQYNENPRKIPASELWSALKSAKCKIEFCPAGAIDDKGKLRTRRRNTQEMPYLSPQLIAQVEHSISWVLNPLSHSEIIDRYRREIEDAILAIEELEVVVNQAVSGEFTLRLQQRELLLRLLKWKATS